ncbi:MAG: nitroreductase/quinone reductase family protein [Acidimicrobiales bacterium]
MDSTERREPAPVQDSGPAAHYKRPDWFSCHVMVPVFNLLMRLGISVWGSRVLEHRGRLSGTLHHTPVNLLTIGGHEFLVAPRGETQWVRNVRAADGRIVLVLGRRRQSRTAVEVPVDGRVDILRSYLRRWKFEVGMFFDGVGPDSTDEELAAIAARHPVFELTE